MRPILSVNTCADCPQACVRAGLATRSQGGGVAGGPLSHCSEKVSGMCVFVSLLRNY